MDYKKLKLKIKEVFDTQDAFAAALGVSSTTLSQRLNNAIEWKSQDIVHACELLGINLEDAYLYFFTPKVQKTEL